MIAQNMVNILKRNNRINVWYGDIDVIEECAIMSGVLKKHPKDTIQSVLNALDKSTLFKKTYIYSDLDGTKRKYRCYTMCD